MASSEQFATERTEISNSAAVLAANISNETPCTIFLHVLTLVNFGVSPDEDCAELVDIVVRKTKASKVRHMLDFINYMLITESLTHEEIERGISAVPRSSVVSENIAELKKEKYQRKFQLMSKVVPPQFQEYFAQLYERKLPSVFDYEFVPMRLFRPHYDQIASKMSNEEQVATQSRAVIKCIEYTVFIKRAINVSLYFMMTHILHEQAFNCGISDEISTLSYEYCKSYVFGRTLLLENFFGNAGSGSDGSAAMHNSVQKILSTLFSGHPIKQLRKINELYSDV